MTKSTHKRYEDFLGGIDLQALRKKYQRIKIVELDMPKNVQALECLYAEYWVRRSSWPDYERFYKTYAKSLETELEMWRRECGFSKETFNRGLPARIYRTWASLLTQIHGAYVAETIYGRGRVHMGVNADHMGKDMVIDLGMDYGRMPIQIKKKSQRSDMPNRRPPRNKYIQVVYAVPPTDRFKRDGKTPRKPYLDWKREYGPYLELLDNGFVIFKREQFVLKKLLDGMVE